MFDFFKKKKDAVVIENVATVELSKEVKQIIDDLVIKYKVVVRSDKSYYHKLVVLINKLSIYARNVESMTDLETVTFLLLDYDKYLEIR